jgi:hypothetical protein
VPRASEDRMKINYLFDNKKINFKKITKTMNEILTYMKEIDEDENKKDEDDIKEEDLTLEENLKNINKKMIKNKKYEKKKK